MGYLHIDNLYKNTEIMMFKECYALEKIHGTSAHISWKDSEVRLFSGGAKHETFAKLFDVEELAKLFEEHFVVQSMEEHPDTVILFGEAYGGKMQGMKHTYGDELQFIVFDVKVNDTWLSVPDAYDVASKLNQEFVDYVKCDTKLETLNYYRDLTSRQAARNGMGTDKMSEGVVLRPLIELKKSNGNRIIVKHKRDEFIETSTPREVDPTKLKLLEEANEIAKEWVTPMRFTHVLDKLGNPTVIEKTGDVVKAMIEDVYREAKGEIVESKAVQSAIGKSAAALYKKVVNKI